MTFTESLKANWKACASLSKAHSDGAKLSLSQSGSAETPSDTRAQVSVAKSKSQPRQSRATRTARLSSPSSPTPKTQQAKK